MGTQGFGSPPSNEIIKLGLGGPRGSGKADPIPDAEIIFFARGGEKPLPLVYGPGTSLAAAVGPSRNYRINGLVAILVNRWHAWKGLASSSMYAEKDIWGWLDWFIGEQCGGSLPYCAGEGDAGVYTHTFLVPIRVARALAIFDGGREAFVRKFDTWLRVFGVHNAGVFTAPGLNGSLPEKERVYGDINHPGTVWDCRLPPDEECRKAGVASCLVGPRTISDYNSGRPNVALVGLRDTVAESVREILGAKPGTDDVTAALLRAGLNADWPFTPAELDELRRAHEGDAAARAAIVAWPDVKPVWHEHRTVAEVYESDGRAAWMETAGGGSTCPCDIDILHPPANGYRRKVVAIANDGRHDAKGGSDTIGPSRVTETPTTLSTRRTDNAVPGAREVTVEKPPGRVTSRVGWGRDGHFCEIGAPAGKPSSPSTPTNDRPADRSHRRGGCPGMLAFFALASSVSACSGCSGSKGGIVIGLAAFAVGAAGLVRFRVAR